MGVSAGVSHPEGVRPSWAVLGAWGAGCGDRGGGLRPPQEGPAPVGTGQSPPLPSPELPPEIQRGWRGEDAAPHLRGRGGLPRQNGGGGNAGGRGPEGPGGCRAPAPWPQFPITRLQKPRRGPWAPLPGFTSPPPCPAGGARLRPPPIPTGVGTAALPAVGRVWRWGYDGAARPRPGPSFPRLRRARGWGRAFPRRREIDPPTHREGRDQVQDRGWGGAGRGNPHPAARALGPGAWGWRALGKEGAGGRKCPLPSRPARWGEARWGETEGYPVGGGALGARWAGAPAPSLRGKVGAPHPLRASPRRGRAGADVSTHPSAARPRGAGVSARPPAAEAGTAPPGRALGGACSGVRIRTRPPQEVSAQPAWVPFSLGELPAFYARSKGKRILEDPSNFGQRVPTGVEKHPCAQNRARAP